MANVSLRSSTLEQGNKRDFPQTGDEVEVEYIGWLLEAGDVISGQKFVPEFVPSASVHTHPTPRSNNTGGRITARMSLSPDKVIAGNIFEPDSSTSCD
jgi:hypothetical protein